MKIDNVFYLMSKRNISATDLARNTGISQGNISDWKSGRCTPKADALIKIADYLDCSVDYLLGRTPEQSFSISNSGGINNSIVGQNNSNVAINNTEHPLSIQEQDLLRIYKNADGKHQLKLMDFAYKIEEECINR